MKLLSKGLLLALLQVVLVCTLGAKLLYDRSHRPHVWIKVATYDPDLPIRGRYLSLNLEVPAEGFELRSQPSPYLKDKDGKPVIQEYSVPIRGDLVLRGDQLVGVANQNGEYAVNVRRRDEGLVAIFRAETTYFLPEHGIDPSRRKAGEELWIDATIPRKGPPRPIRLGIKKDGVLTPLPGD
jgi:hypothetical protein